MSEFVDRSISVVIPSLGRDSLVESVLSALNQSFSALEILIIFDKYAGLSVHTSQRLKLLIQKSNIPITLFYSGLVGAANLRYQGVQMSQGFYVALLDDDDHWFEDHLLSAVQVLSNNSDLIYCSRSLLRIGNRIQEFPKLKWKYKSDISLAGWLSPWFITQIIQRRGIPTPTIIMKRSIAAESKPDSRLIVFEDYSWLLAIERNGKLIYQSDAIGVLVNVSKSRSDKKIALRQLKIYSEALEKNASGAGIRFLRYQIFRSIVKEGDFYRCWQILKLIKTSNKKI